MGRKRWWRGPLDLIILSILHHAVLGDGDIGCLFNKNICDSETETCFNDLAFGKCVSHFTEVDDEKLYQYDLRPGELELLRLQLKRLENGGYTWTDHYTQCILQTSLFNFRYGQERDLRNCHHLMNNERYFEMNNNVIHDRGQQPLPLGIIKFSPDSDDSQTNLRDELHYSPKLRNPYKFLPWMSLDSNSEADDNPPRNDNVRENKAQERIPKKLSRYRRMNLEEERTDYLKQLLGKSMNLRTLKSYEEDFPNDDLEFLSGNKGNNDIFQHYHHVVSEKDEEPFSIEYNKPIGFSDIAGDRVDNDSEVNRDNYDYDDETDNEEEEDDGEIDIETDPLKDSEITEGETILETEKPLFETFKGDEEGAFDFRSDTLNSDENGNPYDIVFEDDLDARLWDKELSGFKRPERLDVKKPGPLFSMNNFHESSPTIEEEDSYEDLQDTSATFKKESNEQKISTLESLNLNNYENVDLDHVYIEFQQEFHTWSEGEHVVNQVAQLLGFDAGSLRDIRVGRAEVTFKVAMRNNKKFNATDVVQNIDNIRGELKQTLGVDVIRAGIGDKAKLPAILEVNREPITNPSWFSAIVAAGVAAASAAAIVTLFIARRHAKYRAKLAGLRTPDPEASRDYQDLCRARMQAKQPMGKIESLRTSLSRQSESKDETSNRSSTSSWSDEAALSNMDISTGHMVLSYMEDHLKNEDRLEQEWAALCAYEAEPSSTEIAESETNKEYNRPGASLTYNHSRVVLNELSNVHNSDYINASIITDHDPRNPAYIATQGPLPETAADFWQLIWEQGSVIIVMLTRLTEDGRATCHHYWPEEGSEVYHIFEVHLVSEHFWCDEYLVRSFYLKNLRTAETRTLTQFHFLSWSKDGIPHSTKALLEFRRKVNKSYRGRSCPIVVHCSDGAARTGTYCLIDMVLNRMAKGAKEIDIAAALEHIRDQRPNMVATKQQFEFVLMAVAEEVHAILKAIPVPSDSNVPTPAVVGH